MLHVLAGVTNLPCPVCDAGIVSVIPVEVVTVSVPGYFTKGKSTFEHGTRPCLAIACNACEFIAEINTVTGELVS